MPKAIAIHASLALLLVTAAAHAADPLDHCNVTWTTPSPNCSGSMPIGNGDVGLNLWVEPSGDLVFYLSKTDAWSENCRLLKLGRVRVKLTPNPLVNGAPFRQTLRLRQGEIEIVAGEGDAAVTIRAWVDANRPVVRVEAVSEKKFDVEVGLEVWRTEKRQLTGKEVHSAYGLHGGPEPVHCFPDTVLPPQEDRLVWYHRNESSIWADNLEHQGLEGFIAKSSDPLLHRTFGGCIRGEGLAPTGPATLESARPASRFAVSVYPLTAQTETAEDWLDRLVRQVTEVDAVDVETGRAEHRRWWDDFWNRSWIRVTGSPEATIVTRGYTLQRWITACGGRGAMPIKFNGSIFTVEGGGYDADYRRWGGPYWWQNTRLPYWPMLAAGDFDMMRPLFDMYRATLPLAQQRTRVWFGHGGAFFPETMYFWGMYTNTNYGWKRAGLEVGEVTNRYIRREYTASPELLAMMLDYHAYTADEAFLRDELLPTADVLLEFWDEHYERDGSGRLHFYPAQALETLQNAENPMPDVAGLRFVLDGLLALPAEKTKAERREFWTRLAGELPPLPMGEQDGEKFLLGAEKVYGGRGNSENPELYAVFPFRLYGVGKPELDIGRRTFARRTVKGNTGWRQDDTQAAFLGLADEAARYVAGRAAKHHDGSRFPAFWGPNFDWIPDQDHGGNLMMALQTMLVQSHGRNIFVLPAWPKRWDAEFKLHAPGRTTIEGAVRGGEVERLEVTPAERRRDVVICEPQ